METGPDDGSTSDVAAEAYRSIFYPENWRPGAESGYGLGLQDYSYAGYRLGEEPPSDQSGLTKFDVTAMGADNTGKVDSTIAIQAAINAAGEAGGGEVYLPSGDYSIAGLLRVDASNVIIRGESARSTKLKFTKSDNLGNASSILFMGKKRVDAQTALVADAGVFDTSVVVENGSVVSVGDTVELGWTISAAFVEAHDMTDVWGPFNGMWVPFFYRRVVAIDGDRITVDVPLRYDARVRDGAALRKVSGHLRECGLEHLSLSNALTDEQAWSFDRVHVAHMRDVTDCWIRDVHSFGERRVVIFRAVAF